MPDRECIASSLLEASRFEFVFEKFQFGLGGLHDGIDAAEFVGKGLKGWGSGMWAWYW